jgi:hypothetical protein
VDLQVLVVFDADMCAKPDFFLRVSAWVDD